MGAYADAELTVLRENKDLPQVKLSRSNFDIKVSKPAKLKGKDF